jgi:UDPglucose 6-dehydrogenase
MRISVLGTGYLGATHAAAMSALGHHVVGFDVDPVKIDHLRSGNLPFFETGLEELLLRGLESGRLSFTTSVTDLAASELHFICVGTPALPSGSPDLTAVGSAIDTLLGVARPGSTVAGRSTVPVGTAARLRDRILPAGLELSWTPEFLREGCGVADSLNPDRIVVGGVTRRAIDDTLRAFQPIIARGVPVAVTDLATAELAKVAANCFLATRISFINAMAEFCDAAGADVTALERVLGLDPRIGSAYLHAGLGYGGGCLPKDLRGCVARAGELGAADAVSLMTAVEQVNDRARDRLIERATTLAGGNLSQTTVAVLGLSFKPDSDDIRDSPALDVAVRLHLAGATVRGFDPQAMGRAKEVPSRVELPAGPRGSVSRCGPRPGPHRLAAIPGCRSRATRCSCPTQNSTRCAQRDRRRDLAADRMAGAPDRCGRFGRLERLRSSVVLPGSSFCTAPSGIA